MTESHTTSMVIRRLLDVFMIRMVLWVRHGEVKSVYKYRCVIMIIARDAVLLLFSARLRVDYFQ
jgi:hypothetical protein